MANKKDVVLVSEPVDLVDNGTTTTPWLPANASTDMMNTTTTVSMTTQSMMTESEPLFPKGEYATVMEAPFEGAMVLVVVAYATLMTAAILTYCITQSYMYDQTDKKVREVWFGPGMPLRGDVRREKKQAEDVRKGQAGKDAEALRRKVIMDERSRLKRYEAAVRWRKHQESALLLVQFGDKLYDALDKCTRKRHNEDINEIYKVRYTEGGSAYREETAASKSLNGIYWEQHSVTYPQTTTTEDIKKTIVPTPTAATKSPRSKDNLAEREPRSEPISINP